MKNKNSNFYSTEPFGIVIFGASGNLASKKLIPALYNLFYSKRISKKFFILGFARTLFTKKTFRKKIKEELYKRGEKNINSFLDRCYYLSGLYDNDESYIKLNGMIKKLSQKYKTSGNLLFYTATPPDLYNIIVEKLATNNVSIKDRILNPFHRIIIEKPFGRDLQSARKLNKHILKYFSEQQIFRIDHYLGKEPVQNILAFRFANSVFENVWNNKFIDHVQISVMETVGVENRAGYYEKYGVIRDMLQNHMMQLLALIAMEPPEKMEENSVRKEKIKVFKSIIPLQNDDIIRGQYLEGKINNKKVLSYRDEPGVDKNSCTETFFATKININNKRWRGVDFYLRGGKRLSKKETKIVIVFKNKDFCGLCKFKNNPLANLLIFKIHPEQEISLTFQAKKPSSQMSLFPIDLHFKYKEVFGMDITDDYENLLIDCMNGDQLFFWHSRGIEKTWQIIDPILNQWDSCSIEKKKKKIFFYRAGSSGPEEANIFINKDGRMWI